MRFEPEWPDRLLPLLLDCFPRAERAVITLVDDASEPSEHWARVRGEYGKIDRPAISPELLRKVLDSGEPLLSLDAMAENHVDTRQPFGEIPIRSVLYAPLFDQNRICIGVVQVDAAQKDHVFTSVDLEFLVDLAAFAETLIVNSDRSTAAEDHWASRLDDQFVPSESPKIDGFRLSPWLSPCGTTSGNLLDSLLLSGDRLAVVVADFVGVDVALKKMNLRAEIRFCLRQEPVLGKAIELLNDRLSRPESNLFLTLLLVVLTPNSGEVSIVNAGQAEPIVHRAGGDVDQDESLGDDAGLPIGIQDGMEYTESKLSLQSGDRIAIFTSGLPEMEDPNGTEFGVDSIRDLLAVSGEADEIRDQIKSSVLVHIGSGKQQDDITLVVIERTAES